MWRINFKKFAAGLHDSSVNNNNYSCQSRELRKPLLLLCIYLSHKNISDVMVNTVNDGVSLTKAAIL